MTHRASNWIPLLLLVLLAAATFWLSRTVTGLAGKGDGAKRHDPDMMVENFTAKQFGEDGHLRYTLSAKKMIHYPDDDTSHLTEVILKDMENDKPPVTATADTALLTQKGDEVFLRGNVVMIREANKDLSRLVIRTDFLHVIPDTGIAQTDRPVVIEDAKTVIHAASMLANNKTQTISLARVNANYDVKK
jgi:lipopolysaccharide export system protein LptC